MHRQDCSFRAVERMKLRKNIEALFQKGEAFSFPPFRVIHLKAETDEPIAYPVRMGISVPKKRFGKAVHRNLLKRRIKEAWRLHKQDLYLQLGQNQQIHCFVIYQYSQILSFADIQAAMIKVQSKLAKIYTPSIL